MSEKYGPDVVTFITYVPSGGRDELGTQTMTPKKVKVYGCRHRQVVRSSSDAGLGRQYPSVGLSVATGIWQTTCPPHPVAMAAKPQQNIEVNGIVYTILDFPGPAKDGTGRPAKVTITSELQTTGH